MTLTDFLAAFANNKGVSVELVDSDDESLITFLAEGYASVESDLGEREVKKVKINGASKVTVIIGDAPTNP